MHDIYKMWRAYPGKFGGVAAITYNNGTYTPQYWEGPKPMPRQLFWGNQTWEEEPGQHLCVAPIWMAVSLVGQEVADTEKSLRIHTEFFILTVFLLSLLVVVCWFVSSRTWDTRRGIYPRNSCLVLDNGVEDVMGEQAGKFFVDVLHGGLVSMHVVPRYRLGTSHCPARICRRSTAISPISRASRSVRRNA